MSAPLDPGTQARASAAIVVATHARPQFLAECLAGIVAALGARDELVVMECCNPEAASLLAAMTGPISHVSTAHMSKTAKLNAAVRAVDRDVILITDDDCRVDPGWVDEMTRPFDNPALGVAFGPVAGLSSVPGSPQRPVHAAGPAPPELWNYAHGASMAVRRSAVIDVGGFDERFGAGAPLRGGEEADLVLRLAEQGWTGAIADAPLVRHLEWRDAEENVGNLLSYQHGGGAYLGAGLRRRPGTTAKPLLLRLRHELGHWREPGVRGWSFGPRMAVALIAGLVRGAALPPRRYLDRPAVQPRSGQQLRVLWVTDEPPNRSLGGGSKRQAMLLDGLHHRADVTLLLVGRLEDDVTRRRVPTVLELPVPRARAPRGTSARRARDLWRVLVRRRPSEVTDSARVHRLLRPVLRRIADDYDIVVVEHLFLAPVLLSRRRARWLLDVQNVPSVRAQQELENETGRRQRWLLSREAENARRHEHHAVASYDGIIVVSDDDAAVLAGNHRERARGPVIVVPNGVDTTVLTPTPIPSAPNVMLPATLNYRPNVLGAIWFCDEVLPLVRSRVPGLRFDLVGRRPVQEVMNLAQHPGVQVHADVPDMTPWFEQARVVVVPLHVGTGTRLKGLEAMAAGRPLVGTAVGLEGIGVVDGEQARIVDDPGAMADAIVELLTSDERAHELATAGRRHVEEHFRWDTLAVALAPALADLAGGLSGARSNRGAGCDGAS